MGIVSKQGQPDPVDNLPHALQHSPTGSPPGCKPALRPIPSGFSRPERSSPCRFSVTVRTWRACFFFPCLRSIHSSTRVRSDIRLSSAVLHTSFLSVGRECLQSSDFSAILEPRSCRGREGGTRPLCWALCLWFVGPG